MATAAVARRLGRAVPSTAGRVALRTRSGWPTASAWAEHSASAPSFGPSYWRLSSTDRSETVASQSSSSSNGSGAAVDPQMEAAKDSAQSGTAGAGTGAGADARAAELAEKDRQIAEYKDLYLRSRAEFENLQKRTAREKQTAKDYAIQSFAKDLVNDLDVLQLALRSVDEPSRTGPEAGKIKDLWEGVNSTRKMLEQTLGRFGVTSFDPEGQAFDPNKHEAIFQAPIPGKEPNTVVCQKIGWMLRDRILRPAQVGVVQESG